MPKFVGHLVIEPSKYFWPTSDSVPQHGLQMVKALRNGQLISSIAHAVMLCEHTKGGNQNSLSAFLPHGSASPPLPKCPFPDRCLHPNDVPYARSSWRAMTTERIDRASDSFAGCDLSISEIANIMSRRQ
jgi:hypothetical protein